MKEPKTMTDFLKQAGVPPKSMTSIQKGLSAAGITHWRVFLTFTPKELAESVHGVSEANAFLISKAARRFARGGTFLKSGRELMQREQERIYMGTGSSRLDHLLHGGWSTGTLVELVGEPQMGKTQLALTAAAKAPLPVEKGGLGGAVMWIDTEGAFRLSRVLHIGARFGADPSLYYDNLFHAEIYSVDDLEDAVRMWGSEVIEKNVKLIIIDSLIDVFRTEFPDLNDLPKRQKRLNALLHKIKVQLRAQQQLVIYTNHVAAKINQFQMVNKGLSNLPVGGYTLGHASDIRIHLRRASSRTREKYNSEWARIARIIDCGWLPEDETFFSFGPLGVCDLEDERVLVKEAEKMGIYEMPTKVSSDEPNTSSKSLDNETLVTE